MVAIGANRSGSHSSLASSQPKKRLRSSLLGTMANELTNPAILNVFDGAWKVMEFSRAESLTEAKGVWRAPNSGMSQ